MRKILALLTLLLALGGPAFAQQNMGNNQGFFNPAGVPGSGTAAGGVVGANLIQNGGMLYDRRHAGASVTQVSGAITADRFAGSVALSTSGAGSPTFQQTNVSSLVGAFTKSITHTNSATPASSTPAALNDAYTHSIEGPDIADLGFGTANGIPITFSGWVKSSVATTFDVSFRNTAANRTYVHDCVAASPATWTQCVVTIPPDPSGSWPAVPNTVGMFFAITLAAGSNAQTTPDTWGAGNFTATANVSNFLLNANATFEFTGFKLERGSVATPYVEDPESVALSKLGHFYQTSAPLGTAPADGIAVAGATCIENPIAAGQPGVFVNLQPPLFAAPTIVTYNPSAGAANNWRNVTAGSDVARTIDPGTAKGVTGFEIATAATVATIAQNLCIHWSADSLR